MSDNGSQRAQEFISEQGKYVDRKRGSIDSTSSNATLAEQCLLNLDASGRGEPCNQDSELELFRRAIVEGDSQAREWIERCFGETVLAWLGHHPSRAIACHLESEEHFIALTFERFWQATSLIEQMSFRMLSVALQYLRVSLNGVILETLRASSRPETSSLLEPGAQDQTESLKLWQMLQTVLPNWREQRLAYLLYHCGFKPGEIVQFCSQEYSDVQEIYHLRHTILDRLMRNADQLH